MSNDTNTSTDCRNDIDDLVQDYSIPSALTIDTTVFQ